MRLLALIICSLLLLPSAAAAKSGIVLDSTPEGYRIGEPWIVTVTAIRNDARVALPRTAAIRIEKQHGGQTRTFAARRQRDGIYIAHVAFPSTGVWTYSVIGIGRLPGGQGWDPVTIRPSKPASSGASVPKAAGGGRGGFPLGWIAAASPIILALGLLVERRRAGRSRSARSAPSPGNSV